MSRIKHFEAKKGKLNKDVAEALFQFTEEYFENENGSSTETDSDDSDADKEESQTAEVHHLLMKNKKAHANSEKDEHF